MNPRRAAAAALVALVIGLPVPVPASHAGALPASPAPRPANEGPWTLPSMPPMCTNAELAAGAVESCLVNGLGRPEQRGWPAPPFPGPDGAVTPEWTDLTVGSSGPVVVTVQLGLTSAGFPAFADGQFGPRTQAAVIAFQTARGLPPTGVVDYATAGALGVIAAGGPVFPPAGWRWLGWAYNGSPALATWEQQFVRSPGSIGRIGMGQVRSMPEAYPLFEGFLREITARGYVINDFGMYAFRCTSNSRKTCEGLTADQLSNHSWGLAVDMNTTANPELTYFGINGASACATPIKSDIPMWVVRAAERWGLYWGGYGWGGGCTSPTQMRTSVLRDTMHFEFRGTPAIARAIVARRASGATAPLPTPTFGAQPPVRLLDSRVGERTGDGLFSGTGLAGGGSITELVVAGRGFVPADAAAVALNVTVTEPVGPGFVTVFPCGTPVPATSNLNFVAGSTIANLVIARVGAGGRVCLYTSTAAHLVADVNASFPAPAGVDAFTPARLLDTRPGERTADGSFSGTGVARAGSVTELPVVGRAGVPAGTAAVALNVTVTQPAGPGFVTVYPCGSPRPNTSNVNMGAGETIANLVVAKVGEGGKVCLFTLIDTHLVVDVGASFASTSVVGALPPSRVLDSRPGGATADGAGSGAGRSQAGSVVQVPVTGRGGVLADASAAVLNVTVTEPTAAGFVTVFPCGAAVPGASNLNFVAGRTIANLVVAKIGDGGRVCLFTSAPTHLVVDVNGSVRGTVAWSDLAIGATGTRVRVLQQALTNAGHPTVIDGQFGARTQSSVIAFQSARGLPANGVVGQATAAALGILSTGA